MQNPIIFLAFLAFFGNAVFSMITQVCMSLIIQNEKSVPSLSLLLGNIAFQLATGLYYSFYWILPSVLASILLKYFEDKCNNYSEEFIQNCIQCIELYEKLSEALKNYLLLWFAAVQSWAVFYTFINLSTLAKKKSYESLDVILTAGSLCHVATVILCLITLTSCLDSAHQCLVTMKTRAQDRLLVSSVREERHQLKYIIMRIGGMGPISARGYFEIDKTTLTSMLSVR